MSVNERLQNERNVWVASCRPDGRAHLAPVWFCYVDDKFWIGTGLTSVKTKNMELHPQISVSLEDGDNPVVAECDVIVHVDHRPEAVAKAFAAKYDWDINIAETDSIGTMVLWEATPTKWLFAQPE